MESTISSRLRLLKEQNGWTAQAMADKTGISRRTLESYMRRKSPALPGPEALLQLAEGLGLSLDWLVLGEDRGRLITVALVRLVTEMAALEVLTRLRDSIEKGDSFPPVEGLSQEITDGAVEGAAFIFSKGFTSFQTVALWQLSQSKMKASLKQQIEELRTQISDIKSELSQE